jgi:hypothetical protein
VYVGSGEHIHGVSRLKASGTAGNSQVASYNSGGDGYGGRDYGPRPPILKNLSDLLSQFGNINVNLSGTGGSVQAAAPSWLTKLIDRIGDPYRWMKDQVSGVLGRLASLTIAGANIGNSGMGKMLTALADKLIEGAGDRIESLFAAEISNYGAGAVGAAAASANAQGVWKSLMSTGYFSEAQAAGVMGNMQEESGFDPWNIQNPGGRSKTTAGITSGYGLVQWTPGTKLGDYIGQNTKATVANSIDTLVKQLQGRGPHPEGAAGSALKRATSPEGAARIFGLEYERYAGPPQEVRELSARAWYNKLAKNKDTGGWLLPGMSLINNNTGRNEAILNPQQWAAVSRLAAKTMVRHGQRLGSTGGAYDGGGERQYNVNFNAPVYAQDPDALARKIHQRDRMALRVAAGVGA